MAAGISTKYAPKRLKQPTVKPHYKASKVQTIELGDIETQDEYSAASGSRLFTSSYDLTSLIGTSCLAKLTGSGSTAGVFDTFNAYVATATRLQIFDQFMAWPGTASVFDCDLLIYQDGWGAIDISEWPCAKCGLIFRKWELQRQVETGKFVCPEDYDEPDQKDLDMENGYRADAIRHAGDLYNSLGEFP